MKQFVFAIAASLIAMTTVSQACNVSPAGRTCYVQETGEYIRGDEFFSKVSQKANSRDACTVGRVKGLQSGRMYDYRGQRIEKDMGCLSHKEISQIKSIYGLRGECRTYTCTML